MFKFFFLKKFFFAWTRQLVKSVITFFGRSLGMIMWKKRTFEKKKKKKKKKKRKKKKRMRVNYAPDKSRGEAL